LGSCRLRLSGMALGVGVGSFDDVETGLGWDIACAIELDRRGSTSPSSWFTIADRSMLGGGRVSRSIALSWSDWKHTLSLLGSTDLQAPLCLTTSLLPVTQVRSRSQARQEQNVRNWGSWQVVLFGVCSCSLARVHRASHRRSPTHNCFRRVMKGIFVHCSVISSLIIDTTLYITAN
jgi:hypothetical protein